MNGLCGADDEVEIQVHSDALSFLSEQDAREMHVLPLRFQVNKSELTVASVTTSSVKLVDRIQKALRSDCRLKLVRLSGRSIAQGLNSAYGVRSHIDTLLPGFTEKIAPVSFAISATDLVEAVFKDAVACAASDIHMLPEDTDLKIRFRIDGVLGAGSILPLAHYSNMLVRLKVIGGLDISETRLPQEGLINCSIFGDPMNFRISTFPVRCGESTVVRLLDTSRTWQALDDLVQAKSILSKIHRSLKHAQGLIVICGPTGVGKTTTLYAMLRELESDTNSIMTLEDPIEFPLPGVRQSSVGGLSKMSLAQAIKGALRQDPDVLLIGELRDPESCQQCIRATLSGRLMLTTIHAASSVMALHRLVELTIERTLVADAVTAIISQRLLRTVCSCCLGAAADCQSCNGSGYLKRIAVYEILEMTEKMRDLIRLNKSSGELLEQALLDGFEPIAQSASALLANGVIDRSEYERTIGPLAEH